jgi:hypothetical protein
MRAAIARLISCPLASVLYRKACRGGFTSNVSGKSRIFLNPPPGKDMNEPAPICHTTTVPPDMI